MARASTEWSIMGLHCPIWLFPRSTIDTNGPIRSAVTRICFADYCLALPILMSDRWRIS